jgi:hypothetical protein
MVSFEQVAEILEREAQERAVGLSPERVTLAGAVGRVVAADLRSERPTQVQEEVPVEGSEPLIGDVILRQGEPFTIANMVIGAELGVTEVVVSPRLSVGVIVVGNDAGVTGATDHQTSYFLPDGSQVMLNKEKILAPEILFAPERIGLEYPGIHEMVVTAIKKCDIDLRK